jgi:hypothetical protein
MAPAGRCLAGHDMADAGRRGCPACRRDRVVDLAAAADRSLPQAAVAAAVDAVVPGGQALWHLEQALAAGPEALRLFQVP